MFARKALAASVSAGPKVYVEDVFSTYLYKGNDTTNTITNNIDLSGKGGLVWCKGRSDAQDNALYDTARGAQKRIISNSAGAEVSDSASLTTFNNNGFTLGADGTQNNNNSTYASWTFRKAQKFFDIVTYTGNGSNRTISHNLGSVPGCIIIKNYSDAGSNWAVYHRSLANTEFLLLNSTAAKASNVGYWNNTTATSTEFTVGTNANVNENNQTFVAYLFAHDAGGFGDAGDQSIIKCGSFTASSGAATVTLDWEPQWILVKRSDGVEGWSIIDNMRSWSYSATAAVQANSSAAEDPNAFIANLTATGFQFGTGTLAASGTYIYIAIRRGPMKTPTSGTSVFSPTVYTGTNADNRLIDTGLLTDMVMIKERNDTVDGMVTGDRLRGDRYLLTGTEDVDNTDADTFMTPTVGFGNAFSAMNGVGVGNDATSKVNIDTTSDNHIAWAFKRAPGFFDVVCWTGTGSARTLSHNLGVTPELILVKRRSTTLESWAVYSATVGNTKFLRLNDTLAETSSADRWNNTSPTSSVFTVGIDTEVNGSGETYVGYLFASLSGVSKIGSYTGNGSSVTVTTDFQPRFILVKRTDSTGNWIVGDSARGLVAGNDPYILLNSAVAEDTDEDWVDITSTSFTVNQTTAANANVNTATYVYLCIA